uniref:YbjN domain-containing protein n=1 Tax=Streptomyces sp. NBC_01393 TaxID=2903851 RepID=A0AAU3IDI8_9ACTN
MRQHMQGGSLERGWDGPWYRVRAEVFEASFLPSEGEHLDVVCNVDVFVTLKDGSRWTATVFTVAEVERLMKLWAETDEALGGRYFWVSDGLIVRDPGIDNMTEVIAGLIENGEFSEIFQRLIDD